MKIWQHNKFILRVCNQVTAVKTLRELHVRDCYEFKRMQLVTGCAAASPVLTATGFVNGKGQFSTPNRIDTAQPITKKIFTGRRPYRYCQIRCTSVHGGFWAHGWNITKIIFIYTPFWELTYRLDPSTDFHAWWLKWRGLAQGFAFWDLFKWLSI